MKLPGGATCSRSHPNFDQAQAALDAARQGDYAPAVYVSRLRPDGKTDRLWTVDLDAEHCEAFWKKNPGKPSKDFS
jgi:hypothetical protein